MTRSLLFMHRITHSPIYKRCIRPVTVRLRIAIMALRHLKITFGNQMISRDSPIPIDYRKEETYALGNQITFQL